MISRYSEPYNPLLASLPRRLHVPGIAGGWLSQFPGQVVDESRAGRVGSETMLTRMAELMHVYVDGGLTIQRFIAAGLIQHVIITRVPVLLGKGIPLFGPLAQDIRFEHVATRSYASGLVQSEYMILSQSPLA